jgi:hypothetical protein
MGVLGTCVAGKKNVADEIVMLHSTWAVIAPVGLDTQPNSSVVRVFCGP